MKLRAKTQTFKVGSIIKSYFCIEILQGRKWTFLGDDSGIFRFEDKQTRDTKIEELRRELNIQP